MPSKKNNAAARPLALVIEDLHWSDPSTVVWLGEVLDSLAAVPCLTLLTARSSFRPAWPAERSGKEAFLVIDLPPLPPDQAEALVTGVDGERPLAGDLRQRIIAQADGNPLFIEELTKTLLERPASSWNGMHAAEIPATLQDRLDHLGPAKETAQWAAALGREFSYPVQQACAPYDEQRLQSDLAHLIEAELVSPIQAAPQDAAPYVTDSTRRTTLLRYTFKHTLVQEAAYASLLKRTRQMYHHRIAETLENRFPWQPKPARKSWPSTMPMRECL